MCWQPTQDDVARLQTIFQKTNRQGFGIKIHMLQIPFSVFPFVPNHIFIGILVGQLIQEGAATEGG
jgi:hypothetical protein